ncbi:hypothetical protein [Rickettsia endosymbiont of Gonocerus acuteangulatus]|uniref:hypothetical protein n=1 Tax=Rickettsia endosymbiont of Gonocerus acuteangulatus TaxID=3066266 RepID=UPI003132F10A
MATTDTSKRSNSLRKSLEKTLSSSSANKLFKSAIKDLSSSKSLSFKTLLLGAKFVLTNPVNTYNLIKLANSSDTYLDPEFQKSLLEKKPIWEFLKSNAENLPKIGQILDKAGFKEFQEGSFLDQKGLYILKESFKNDSVLDQLKEVAIEVKKEEPDWTKVASNTLDLLTKDKNFEKFFNEKGKNIADYIRTGATEILPSDYVNTFDDILQKPENKQSYAEVQKIFDKNPALKQEVAENIDNLRSLKEFNNLSPEKQTVLNSFVADAKQQAKPALKEYFENYRIDPKVLSTVPSLLNEIPKIKEVFDTLNDPNQGLMIAIEKTLEMTKDNKDLRDFFANNKEFLPNAALGIIKNNSDLQKMTRDYNFDKQMLNIVGEMMSKPEMAHDIMLDVNKGDYMSVTNSLISALNDPSFKLKDTLVQQSKDSLFDNLLKGIVDVDVKDSGVIKQQLENYGLQTEDVIKLSKVMPLLLDKPESLQKVFSGFIKGDYTGIAKELITLTKDNPEIQQYLNDNKKIFANIMDKTLEVVAGVGNLDKEKIYNILPSMLNHPDELVKIIEGVENSNYTNAASSLYNLAQKTNYFEGQLPSLAKAGVKIGLNYVAGKVINIFSDAQQPLEESKITDKNILIDQAIDKVFLQAKSENKQNLPNKKEFANEVKTICKENPELENYIVEKLSSKPISSVGDVSTPKTNQYSHISEHINSPMQVLNPLYENLVNKQDIKVGLLANMLSEQVSQKLFDRGDNRGEDFHMINQTLKQVISEHIKENPNIVDHFSKPKNQEKLINNIANTLNAKSKYTWAGLATGGIYLPKEIFNNELKDNLKAEFKNNFHSNTLAEAKNMTSNLREQIVINTSHKLSPSSNSPIIHNKNTQEKQR